MQLPQPPQGVELWTIRRTCEQLQVCRRTVYYWLANGRIDYVRTAGGPVRIVSSSCYQLVRES